MVIKVIKVLVVTVALLLSAEVQAATMGVYPSTVTRQAGDRFSVSVVVSSPVQSVNGYDGVVTFPSDLLQATGVSKGRMVDIWTPGSPSISNAAGTVSFSGVSLPPGFTGGSGTVLTINFLTKKSGTGKIAIKSASILANDGSGTNVITAAIPARMIVTEKVVTPVIPPTPATEKLIKKVTPKTPKKEVKETKTTKEEEEPAEMEYRHLFCEDWEYGYSLFKIGQSGKWQRCTGKVDIPLDSTDDIYVRGQNNLTIPENVYPSRYLYIALLTIIILILSNWFFYRLYHVDEAKLDYLIKKFKQSKSQKSKSQKKR